MSKRPQPIAHLRLEADGGSRGNPGIAGSGSVLYDVATAEQVEALAFRVGAESNNVAEYLGLLRGLEAALAYQPQRVDIFLDSKLVVEQMSGRWKIKHPRMQELALECQAVLRHIPEHSFTWIPRAQNKKADELSNVAMDDWKANPHMGFVAGYEPLATAELSDAANQPSDAAPALNDAVGREEHLGAEGAVPESADTPETNAPETNAPDSTADAAADSAPDPTFEQLSLLDSLQAPAAAAHAENSTQDSTIKVADWKGATTECTRLVLLRHGQTEMSVKKLYSGRSNPELTDFGMQQAAAAAQFLAAAGGFAAIISSPLQRCQQTAQAVADLVGGEVVVDEALLEIDFGKWEAKSFAQVQQADAEFHKKWLQDPTLPTPDGESVAQVHERVTKFREKICAQYPGHKVLIVSHVTPIKSLIAQGMQVPINVSMQIHLDLASVSVADFYADGPTCVSVLNERSYYAKPEQIV